MSSPLQQAGPAQSEYLIHFCGRPAGTSMNDAVPAAIVEWHPCQRLDNILWEQRLYAFPPFGADQPMVCLSETPADHLDWLLATRGWPPWGLVFTRQQVYEAGGGPVWYARQAQYEALTWELRQWAVRFDTTLGSTSDWLHEREWRIPVEPEVAALGLPVGSVTGVLIGDPTWTPSSRLVPVDTGTFINSATGAQTWPDDPYAQPYIAQAWSLPTLWATAPHWYWDPTSRQLHSV